jgi:osmotically inducible protein OsmC
MAINKSGSAHWEGSLKDGKGTVSTESTVLSEAPYGFNNRFEGESGTNPEELIAAAHASCFSMAFSMVLGQSDLTAKSIETKAVVTLDKDGEGFAVQKSALACSVFCDGDEDTIREAADGAKDNCPISKLLNCDITLDLVVN